MSFAIVYSSQTGNTAMLAETIKQTLPEEACVYYGVPPKTQPDASLLFVGFWTDKGTCDADTAAFLQTLHHRKVFLFGTAGFGGSASYYQKVLQKVKNDLDESNEVVGTFLCQGKMPLSVRKRYEAMQNQNPEAAQAGIENFDRACLHPDALDLAQLTQDVQQIKMDFRDKVTESCACFW